MTVLVLGLIAAVGIGGGVAAASNGGGGHSSSPHAVSAPATTGFYSKPEKLSVISNEYTHVTTTDSSVSFSGPNTLVMNNMVLLPGGSGGIFHEEWDQNLTVSFTLDDYNHSDTWADYFTKTGPSTSGQWDDMPGVTWTYESQPELVLGGRAAGLTAADFGYFNDRTHVYNTLGENSTSNDIMTFYMYDTTRMMDSVSRSDTAHFDGGVLGSMYYDSDDDDKWRDDPLTGTASLDLNFATSALSGTIDTQVNGKAYHLFNVSGMASNSGSIYGYSNALSVDSSKAVDSSLSAYAISPSGSGNSYLQGQLLNGTNGAEMVGKAYYLQGDLEVGFSFGAKEYIAPVVTPDPGSGSGTGGSGSGSSGSSSGSGSGSGTGSGSSTPSMLISPVADSVKFPNLLVFGGLYPSNYTYALDAPTFSVGNNQLVWGTSLLKTYTGYGAENRTETHIDLTFTSSDYKEAKSTSKFDYYEKSNTTSVSANYSSYLNGTYNVTQTNTVMLGGKKLGLTAAEFGILQEVRSGMVGSYETTRGGYTREGHLLMYEQDRLYDRMRSDQVAFSGNVFFTDLAYADLYFNINFANDSLRGYTYNSSDGKRDVSFVGDVVNRNMFSISSTMDSSQRPSGSGVLLKGDNGLEAVGTMNMYVLQEDGEFVNTSGVFGAKEVK